MDKKTYYVAVGSGEILPNRGDAAFEFEIKATEEELDKLEELFEDTAEAERSAAARAVIPFEEYHNDEENDRYDDSLHAIYRMLHQLGTLETRRHIESMNVMEPR
ncbi:MAG: hypothetical protein J7639_16050 [Paenibacillaceae bacterium]|nr:hypothetical protein [Paenibacillaceae bacterium]